MRNRSRFGWIELIEGILLIILGIFSFLSSRQYVIRLCHVLWTYCALYRNPRHYLLCQNRGTCRLCANYCSYVRMLKRSCWSDASCISWCCEMGFFTFLPDVVYRPLHFTTVTAANDTRLDSKMALLLYYDCKHRWSFSWHFHADSPCCCTHIT